MAKKMAILPMMMMIMMTLRKSSGSGLENRDYGCMDSSR
jgi:hypothetical protein